MATRNSHDYNYIQLCNIRQINIYQIMYDKQILVIRGHKDRSIWVTSGYLLEDYLIDLDDDC